MHTHTNTHKGKQKEGEEEKAREKVSELLLAYLFRGLKCLVTAIMTLLPLQVNPPLVLSDNPVSFSLSLLNENVVHKRGGALPKTWRTCKLFENGVARNASMPRSIVS